jgi:multiple sugar transport system substrate-binding protein
VIQGETETENQPKAAMILTDSLLVAELPADSQAELDFFSFPILDPSVAVAQSVIPMGYVTPVKADHAPEAVAFLSYLASAEAQTTLAKHLAGGSVTVAPTRTDIDI